MDTLEPQNENFENRQAKGKEAEKHSHGRPHKYLTMRALVGLMALAIIVSSLFGALFGFMSAGVVTLFSPSIGQMLHQYFPSFKTRAIDKQVSKQQVLIEDSAVIDVVDKSSVAVVSIVISKNVSVARDPFDIPGGFFNPFSSGTGSGNANSQGTQKENVGAGSGFFITADGLILTNKHVVDDQQAEYTVITSDGKEYPAKVLAQDPIRDAAIIKVEGDNFPVLPLGDSDSLKIGQTAIAIGNSLGEFSNSVSRGIVSGLKRNINASSGFGASERLTDIIQTDAAINPGNSGGPLLNIDGAVIGINIATAQGAQNVGFALPVNQVKRIISQVETGAKVTVPFLGVRYIVMDPAVQKASQVPFDYGVLVLRGDTMTDLAVIPGSPADIAGIMENDIILEINGEKITKNNQLGDIIIKYNVGDNITLKVWHKGQVRDVNATLQELKQ